MMLIENKPHCTIEYDSDLKCVIQTWKGFARSQQFRASIQKTIDVFGEYDAHYIISNTQQSEVVSQADADWVATYANPILVGQGLRKMAFLAPQSVVAQWRVKHFVQETSAQPVAIRYFNDLEQAKTWISS